MTVHEIPGDVQPITIHYDVTTRRPTKAFPRRRTAGSPTCSASSGSWKSDPCGRLASSHRLAASALLLGRLSCLNRNETW